MIKQGPRYRRSQSQGQDRGQQAAQIREIQEVHHQHLRDVNAEIAACKEREQQLREELIQERLRHQQVAQQLVDDKEYLIRAREAVTRTKPTASGHSNHGPRKG